LGPTQQLSVRRLVCCMIFSFPACGGGSKVVSGEADSPAIEPGTGANDTGAGFPDTGGDSGTTTQRDDPLSLIDSSTLPAGGNPCRAPTFGEVQDVTDGDTIRVMTGRGSERVRLIGIDSPEVDHDGDGDECWANEATDFVRDTLEGTNVWLTFDAECEDYYERTLAYVHVGVGDRGFFQRTLLLDGFAEAFSVSPNTAFASQFSADEQIARDNGQGQWSACP
jgi:micrococcal nuclease